MQSSSEESACPVCLSFYEVENRLTFNVLTWLVTAVCVHIVWFLDNLGSSVWGYTTNRILRCFYNQEETHVIFNTVKHYRSHKLSHYILLLAISAYTPGFYIHKCLSSFFSLILNLVLFSDGWNDFLTQDNSLSPYNTYFSSVTHWRRDNY